MTRLQGLTLNDFTGGLSIRPNSFQVGDNETPAMVNIHVDPRGGFTTRNGWRRWNDANIELPWDPRHAELHQYADGTYAVYVTNNGKVWRAGGDGAFTDTGIVANCVPHLADFASWGDKLYIATGATGAPGTPCYHDQTGVTNLTPATSGTWNPDYTTAVGGVFPRADVVESHGGYIFAAAVFENTDGESGDVAYPNRLRWSHPNQPEDWAELDYIDIAQGGGKINALKSFTDHLLIFKDQGVWALFGYDSESWQLVQVSVKSGSISPTTVTASQDRCFFYSPTGRGEILMIAGATTPDPISERIKLVLSESTKVENVWLNWAANRLFCSLPWVQESPDDEEEVVGYDSTPGTLSGPSSTQTTTFTYDPSVGQGGSWEAHVPAEGSLRTIMQLPGDKSPIAVHAGQADNSCLLRLGDQIDAVDILDQLGTRTPFPVYYSTNWKDGGTEELRKSWRRPRFIVRNPGTDIEVRVDAYRNYDNTSKYRSWVFGVTARGRTYWRDLGAADPNGDGFDWDDGSEWVGNETGSRIVRGGPLGVARSVRLVMVPTPAYRGTAWGVDAVTLKYINRRFTT